MSDDTEESNPKPRSFAVYWADSKELLTKEERRSVLQIALLEALSPDEVLLRDPDTKRLIVVRSATEEHGLFCALCRSNMSKRRYGKTCPKFATCIYHDRHKKLEKVS